MLQRAFPNRTKLSTYRYDITRKANAVHRHLTVKPKPFEETKKKTNFSLIQRRIVTHTIRPHFCPFRSIFYPIKAAEGYARSPRWSITGWRTTIGAPLTEMTKCNLTCSSVDTRKRCGQLDMSKTRNIWCSKILNIFKRAKKDMISYFCELSASYKMLALCACSSLSRWELLMPSFSCCSCSWAISAPISVI